jgi:uncharacterized protein with NAD-binding domain and iron-sulfur cluster
VLRFPKAVTHFSPGSYPFRPYQVTGIPNCFLAGDWVKGVSACKPAILLQCIRHLFNSGLGDVLVKHQELKPCMLFA